jgi:hypothetical protein
VREKEDGLEVLKEKGWVESEMKCLSKETGI